MAGPQRKWRSSFLGPRDARGAPAAADIVATNHVTDPDTELAPWFLGGMSLPEMELTLQDLETKGDDGSFIMCDLSFLAPRAVYTIRVLNGGLIEEFVVERAPTPPGGYRLKGMALHGTDEAWPTVFSLVECLSNEIRAPLPVKLDLRAAFLGGGMPSLVRRRTSRRRSKRRMSAMSVGSATVSMDAEDEQEELFGFGDLLDDVAATAKLQTLDTAFNLRDVLRRQATALERHDEQERMRDPFWEEAEAERRRNKEYNRRTLSAEQLKRLDDEAAAVAATARLRVKAEQTALHREAQQAKRATIMGRPDTADHRRASGDASAVDDLLTIMHKASTLADGGSTPPPSHTSSIAGGDSTTTITTSANASAISPAGEDDLVEVDGPGTVASGQSSGGTAASGQQMVPANQGADARPARRPSHYGGFAGVPEEEEEGEAPDSATSTAMDATNADFESNPDEVVGALPEPVPAVTAVTNVVVTVTDDAADAAADATQTQALMALLGIAEEAGGGTGGAEGQSAVDDAQFGDSVVRPGRKQSIYQGFAAGTDDDAADDDSSPIAPAPAPPAAPAAAEVAPMSPPPVNRFAGRQKTMAKKEPAPEPEPEATGDKGKRRFRLFAK